MEDLICGRVLVKRFVQLPNGLSISLPYAVCVGCNVEDERIYPYRHRIYWSDN